MRASPQVLWLVIPVFGLWFVGKNAFANEAKADRIKIEYLQPTNPQHQETYYLLKSRGALEKLQQIFAPLKLPLDLLIKTASCGEENAWYERPQMKPAITICYEYIEAIKFPIETTPAGITRTDAIFGQFFYVSAHEVGHAVFDILDIPIFGRLEDAADQFAVYVMLQFGKEQARRSIGGAAYSYKEDVLKSEVTTQLKSFSDSHSAPQARFFNILCLAYVADQKLFSDLIERGYLPESRAKGCKRELGEVAFAFKHLIRQHLDDEMAKRILEAEWLPKEDTKPSPAQRH
jgi:hypothetical protein